LSENFRDFGLKDPIFFASRCSKTQDRAGVFATIEEDKLEVLRLDVLMLGLNMIQDVTPPSQPTATLFRTAQTLCLALTLLFLGRRFLFVLSLLPFNLTTRIIVKCKLSLRADVFFSDECQVREIVLESVRATDSAGKNETLVHLWHGVVHHGDDCQVRLATMAKRRIRPWAMVKKF
jgi:hypothetical protein